MSITTLDGIRRDQWGRPQINIDGKNQWYTRVSTLANTLDDKYGLINWQSRITALGLAARPDLLALASTLSADEEDKEALQAVVDQALATAGSDSGANHGTALHKWTEWIDTGQKTLREAPAAMRADLDAYKRATSSLTTLDAEVFVVHDEFKCAGTFDRLVRMADGRVVIADLKTGKWAAKYGQQAVAVQMAVYATGRRYDIETYERTVIHPNLDTDTGLLVHLPLGQATCDIYEIDLSEGLRAARAALWVRDWRKRPVATPYTPPSNG